MILYMYIAPEQGLTAPGNKVLMSKDMSCHFIHLLQAMSEQEEEKRRRRTKKKNIRQRRRKAIEQMTEVKGGGIMRLCTVM